MSPSEAFALLGVPETADEEAVKEAYRQQSMLKHPDRPGGDTGEQSQLNEAYAVALSVAGPHNALALRAARSIQRVESALLVERSARQAEGAARSINRRRRGRLDRLRNLSLMAGVLAGVSFLFSDYLLDPLLEAASEAVRRGIRLQLGVVTVGFGAAALWMQTQVQRLGNAIEAYLEDFSDRKLCAERLAGILRYRDDPVVADADIQRGMSDRSPEMALTPVMFLYGTGLTDDEIGRILLPKAVEHRLLTPIESDPLDALAEMRYQVLFRPSTFRPQQHPPPEPPKPMSAKEARSMAIAGTLAGLALGSLTAYLAFSHRTWWAILPGLPTFGAMTLIVEGLRAWLTATGHARENAESGPGE